MRRCDVCAKVRIKTFPFGEGGRAKPGRMKQNLTHRYAVPLPKGEGIKTAPLIFVVRFNIYNSQVLIWLLFSYKRR